MRNGDLAVGRDLDAGCQLQQMIAQFLRDAALDIALEQNRQAQTGESQRKRDRNCRGKQQAKSQRPRFHTWSCLIQYPNPRLVSIKSSLSFLRKRRISASMALESRSLLMA